MSARKDIFDTFIKGKARMYKSFERWRWRRNTVDAVVTIKVLI